MEIIPGIHQLRIPIPGNMLGYTNVYLVQGNDGWLLVDTGSNHPATFISLQSQLQEIGLDFRDISQIVVTHEEKPIKGVFDLVESDGAPGC